MVGSLPKKLKFFVSQALPGQMLGAMQFEANDIEDAMKIAEAMAPTRGFFKAYIVQEFDKDIPISKFVYYKQMKKLGY